jgi:hypothetical protein
LPDLSACYSICLIRSHDHLCRAQKDSVLAFTLTVVQAWLTGVNPELGDRAPLRLMRESEIDAVAPGILSAAKAYLSDK